MLYVRTIGIMGMVHALAYQHAFFFTDGMQGPAAISLAEQSGLVTDINGTLDTKGLPELGVANSLDALVRPIMHSCKQNAARWHTINPTVVLNALVS